MAVLAAYAVMILFCSLTSSMSVHGAIGMNWGRQSAQRLVPSMVVDILLQNNVSKARIYTSQPDILEAFSGSGIDLTVSILNAWLVNNKTRARDWVQKVLPYLGPANIRRVYVGNYGYVKPQVSNGISSQPVIEANMRTMKLVQETLNMAGRGYSVSTNMPLPYEILKPKITKPSEAEFHEDIKPYLTELLAHLVAYKAPLLIQMFPIVFVNDNHLDPDFAFVGGGSRYVVVDDANGAVYNNVFEFMYDSVLWALEKMGAPSGVEVTVAQIGWPTDGYPGANSSTAERFFRGLLPFVLSSKGTPKRPGRPIEIYVHSLTDEPQNPVDQPFARHWGVYRSNGEPKYKIDLSGLGRDIYPAQARGIQLMPERWCTFNKDMSNLEKVYRQLDVACGKSDCTASSPGGSCSGLSFKEKVSYAFNMFFQTSFQNETQCVFEGLGQVVPDNPSVGTCVFPIEVVKGRQLNYISSSSTAVWERLHPHEMTGSRGMLMFVVVLLSVIFVL